MQKFFPLAVAAFFAASNAVFGAIVLNSPTTDWHAIAYSPNRSDYINDPQGGAVYYDLAGSAPGQPTQTALYYTYDADSNQIGFRVRIHAVKKAGDPFEGVVWVGFMLDSNDSVDLFAGFVRNTGNESKWGIGFYNPGGGANVSPNTTTINSTAISSVPLAVNSNYLWTPVTVGPSGNDPVTGGRTDVGDVGNQNYFLTWTMSFSAFQSAAASLGFSVTPDSPMRFVVGTANQTNSINRDINGTNGNISSTSTYTELGATSPVITPGGGPVVIPEPGTVSLCAVGAAYALFHLRSRRRR